jgi:hypothetical protein
VCASGYQQKHQPQIKTVNCEFEKQGETTGTASVE